MELLSKYLLIIGAAIMFLTIIGALFYFIVYCAAAILNKTGYRAHDTIVYIVGFLLGLGLIIIFIGLGVLALLETTGQL